MLLSLRNDTVVERYNMFYPSLIHDYLSQSASNRGDKPFIICGDKKWSYRDIDSASTSLAHQLVANGINYQDKVAILLDNSAEVVIALYAVSKAGGTFVIINSTVKAGKLSFILNNSDAKLLITHTSKGRTVIEAMESLEQKPLLIWVSPTGQVPAPLSKKVGGQNWNGLVCESVDASKNHLPRAIDQDLAALIYTSGSTGQPKGVMQPHYKMIGVAKSIIQYLENDSDDVILNVLSLSFGYGLYQVLMAAIFGGTVVLEKGFVYLHDTLSKIAEHGVTAFPFVPTVLAMMLRMEQIGSYDFASLKYVTNAGAALPVHHSRQLRKLIPDAKIYPMYGLTECVRVCYLNPEFVDKRPDSVGFEIPNCSVIIVDENGKRVPPGQVGELVVTGSNVMPGYYKDSKLSEKVFRPGDLPGQTHLYTGDLFKRDRDGFLYFVSRKNDMIKTRGERVSPLEVENFIMQLDGVAEAVVIGVPDDILGEVVKAFVVLSPASEQTDRSILKYCSETMENYMVPKYLEIMEALPKTPNGKINKKQLKNSEDNES